jgi:methyl-accepting chemotaxis protein
LGQIDQVTQANTASAEESASAAEELASQAEQLRASIADFKLHESSEGRYLGAPRRPQTKGTNRTKAQPSEQPASGQKALAGSRKNSAAGAAQGGTHHGARSGAPNAEQSGGQTGAQGAGTASGNGSHHSEGNGDGRPEEVIKLDDDEFDRF